MSFDARASAPRNSNVCRRDLQFAVALLDRCLKYQPTCCAGAWTPGCNGEIPASKNEEKTFASGGVCVIRS